ncbi:hypothetical protein PENSPDRAFT_669356 [Peniophora sp. CONT]|nr:hypothetical protein PENSPDRAFT_669356 [Peniophora sp. CONT]
MRAFFIRFKLRAAQGWNWIWAATLSIGAVKLWDGNRRLLAGGNIRTMEQLSADLRQALEDTEMSYLEAYLAADEARLAAKPANEIRIFDNKAKIRYIAFNRIRASAGLEPAPPPELAPPTAPVQVPPQATITSTTQAQEPNIPAPTPPQPQTSGPAAVSNTRVSPPPLSQQVATQIAASTTIPAETAIIPATSKSPHDTSTTSVPAVSATSPSPSPASRPAAPPAPLVLPNEDSGTSGGFASSREASSMRAPQIKPVVVTSPSAHDARTGTDLDRNSPAEVEHVLTGTHGTSIQPSAQDSSLSSDPAPLPASAQPLAASGHTDPSSPPASPQHASPAPSVLPTSGPPPPDSPRISSPANDEDEVIVLTEDEKGVIHSSNPRKVPARKTIEALEVNDPDDPALTRPVSRGIKGKKNAVEAEADEQLEDDVAEDEDNRPKKPSSGRSRSKRHLRGVKKEAVEDVEAPAPTRGARSKHVRANDKVCTYVARLWSYGSVTTREAAEWGSGVGCAVGNLHMALYDWEHACNFEEGELEAPGLTVEMRENIERLSFPKKLRTRKKGERAFSLDVVDAMAQLRLETFSQARKMCGKYGLSLLVRALVDARHFDRTIVPDFLPLVEELTLVLEGLARDVKGDKSKRTAGDASNKDDVDDDGELQGSVLDFLTSRARSQTAKNTRMFERLIGDIEDDPKVGEKRKIASVKDSETPSPKRQRKASGKAQETLVYVILRTYHLYGYMNIVYQILKLEGERVYKMTASSFARTRSCAGQWYRQDAWLEEDVRAEKANDALIAMPIAPPPEYNTIFPPPSYAELYPLPPYDEDAPPHALEVPVIIIIPPTPPVAVIPLAPNEQAASDVPFAPSSESG